MFLLLFDHHPPSGEKKKIFFLKKKKKTWPTFFLISISKIFLTRISRKMLFEISFASKSNIYGLPAFIYYVVQNKT